jgi:hypothetical protein
MDERTRASCRVVRTSNVLDSIVAANHGECYYWYENAACSKGSCINVFTDMQHLSDSRSEQITHSCVETLLQSNYSCLEHTVSRINELYHS